MTTSVIDSPATNGTMPTATPARRRANPTSTAAPQPAPSKSDTVIKLLLRAKGATPIELIAATDWQPHSVRAFLSGLRKKGRSIVRDPRKNGEPAYRIIAVQLVPSGDGSPALLPAVEASTEAEQGAA